MNRSIVGIVLMLGGALFAQDIHLKSRTLAGGGRPAAVNQKADAPPRHWIIEFDHYPGVEDLDGLLQDGLDVVGALPDNAVVVGAVQGGVPARAGRRWVGVMEATDKVSPELVDAPDGSLAVVEFHADVSGAQQDAVATAEGLTLQRPAVLRADHAVVTGTRTDFDALALHDEVAYIFPADPGLLGGDSSLMPCLGMLTATGLVGQYANIVHGWDLGPDHLAHLGYFFGSVTPKVPAATVQSEVVRALNEWSRIAGVVFQPAASGTAARTVLVKFVSGAHGDAWPFDGPGGILAHTFYPLPVSAESVAGDMHMDADENWHAGGDLDIYSVALHEAGHAIGLGHSDKPGDVMYPYYRNGRALSANDIGAAQALYGSLTSPVAVSDPGTGAPGPIAPPPPLRLTLDSTAATAAGSAITLTGTLGGGTAPLSVQWQSDRGYSGQGRLSGTSWLASQVSLANGVNNITVTGFDAGRQTSSQTVSVTLPTAQAPPSAGSGPPISISITSPASAVATVNGASVSISGKASGGAGVSKVTWQTAAGAAGIATGTSQWIAQNVPLPVGTNTLVMRAWDAKGASAWAAVVVVRH